MPAGSRPEIEHHLDIPTDDRATNSAVVHPAEEGGPFRVVLLCMDAPRRREERQTRRGV